MSRLLVLLSVTSLLLITPDAAAGSASVAMLALVAAAFTIAAVVCLNPRSATGVRGVAGTGPVADERRLHGAFRRLTSPDSPGRPRPRAPGAGLRPV
jgi:hypothetical protein